MKPRIATPWQRVSAFALDYLVILAYVALLIATTFVLRVGPMRLGFDRFFAHSNTAEIGGFLTLTLPVILYFALMECSHSRATFGKRRVGIYVTTIAGGRLRVIQSLVRSIVKLLPWELAHAALWQIPGWPRNPQPPAPLVTAELCAVWLLVGFYLMFLWFQRAHRTPYDLIAGSVVCVKPENRKL